MCSDPSVVLAMGPTTGYPRSDVKIAGFIAKGLRERGYVVDVAHDGETGSDLAHAERYEAAIIDIMLPGIDGLTLIEGMRAAKLRTPVLILSARRTIDDRVKGLRAGGMTTW